MPPAIETSKQPLSPGELLPYLPQYGVVVCTTCQYAVQPGGISRHLKEIHHILRSQRRPFMKYIEGLDLRPIKDVISIDVLDFPVPLLPVFDGLECRTCKHLCLSEKRMKSHMISVHGHAAHPFMDWHSVPIQTFFRGNLLRYFTTPAKSKPVPPLSGLDLSQSNDPDVQTRPQEIQQVTVCILWYSLFKCGSS